MSSSLENRKVPAGSAWREAPVAVLPMRRRLRNVFNGRTLLDTTDALILFEHDHLPVYYVPVADVDAALLVASDRTSHCARKGDASYWSIVVGDRTAPDAVWGYETNPVDGAPDLSGYRAFSWNAVDHWYEEDEEVFAHRGHRRPRRRGHRLDVHASDRRVPEDRAARCVLRRARRHLRRRRAATPARERLVVSELRAGSRV